MPLSLDLALCDARRLPRPLSEVRSVAAVLATMVRGGPQFGVAAPVDGVAASSVLIGELLLGMGST
jgi:hypothetical protein